MSKRTLRRAAERQARKQAQVANIALPPLSSPLSEPAASEAQVAANRANAQLSTGPVTPGGKAIVSQNRRCHGLTGIFQLLPHESAEDLEALRQSIYDEYQPATPTEQRLAEDMVQHYWLAQRAIFCQQDLMYSAASAAETDPKRLALFMRYQTTHERSYYKAMSELKSLKSQIGFESQVAKTRLANARARILEIDAAVRQVMEAPLPGAVNIPFDEIANACGAAIANLACKHHHSDLFEATAA